VRKIIIQNIKILCLFPLFMASLMAVPLHAAGTGEGVPIPRAVRADTLIHRYEYVLTDGRIYVYDIDNAFHLIDSISVPTTQGTRGVSVSPADGLMYISYRGDGGFRGNGSILQLNLLTKTIGWSKNYSHGVDSHEMSPDGTIIYSPDGELSGDGKWYLVSTKDGSETGAIINTSTSGPHNTIVSLDGSRVFMGDRDPYNAGSDYFYVANTTNDSVIQKVGPIKKGIRPFTVNGKGTIAYITTTGMLGFQVGDLATGNVPFTIDLSTMGFTITRCVTDGFTGNNCQSSHGISLSPDETKIYVIDSPNSYVHVFDVSGVENNVAPTKIKDIHLNHPLLGQAANCAYDCLQIGWLQHSIDGRYVFVGDAGDVISTANDSIIAFVPQLRNTRKCIEVDWQNGVAIANSTRQGMGRVAGALPPSAPPAPVLALPPNSSTGESPDVQLAWHSANGAISYHVEVATDSLFNSVVANDSAFIDSSKQILSLADTTKYYWRVSAKNSSGASPWSQRWWFVTGGLSISVKVQVAQGWNMLSVPDLVPDFSKTAVFPNAASEAFNFGNGYAAAETLANGMGYWIKYSRDTAISISGRMVNSDQVNVVQGWNMIGAVSVPIPAATISSVPGGIITSQFFAYNGSYIQSDTLKPGYGYWVKADQTGRLVLSASTSVSRAGRITIIPVDEQPPSPPNQTASVHGNIPRDYALDQSYPNPFNPAATINYQLPVESMVSLRIYDMLGRLVATLTDGVRNAGYESVRWSPNTMASGMYFCRLEAASVADPSKTFSQVRKMLLMK
jgi:hypothetical protein